MADSSDDLSLGRGRGRGGLADRGRLGRIRGLSAEGRRVRAGGLGVAGAMAGVALLGFGFGLARRLADEDASGAVWTFVVGVAIGLSAAAWKARRDPKAFRLVLLLASGFALLLAAFWLLSWLFRAWSRGVWP